MSFFKEKNLLIVSYYLPPTKTVAVVRIYYFHLEAQKYFQEVFSMTTSNRQLFPKDQYDFNDKNTTEVWTYDLRKFLNRKKNNIALGYSTKTKSSRFVQFLSKLSYSFPFNIFLDDGGLTYILGGFFKGKKLVRENNIQVLFSSYKPYADHLICFLLKKWNPNLIWIADFRDLHVDEVRQNILFPKIQKWFNRKILKRADIVTTVSKGLEKSLQQHTSKTYVLKNGIPSSDSFEKKQSSYKRFTIAYTGSIYPNLQNADLLFKALQKLILEKKMDAEKVELIYAGKDGNVWSDWLEKFNLKNISTIHGFLSKEEAQDIQQNSHVNLLLSWASENQQGILTAKFYDYLVAQNPMLLIINGSKDEEFENLFEELQAGIVTYDNSDFEKQVEGFILGKYQEWEKTGKVKSKIPTEKLNPFKWDAQANDFFTYLESVIESP